MSICAQEDKLFNEWRNHRVQLVTDGVVSEKDYLDSKYKICFVLKEVNDPDGGGWDLREYLANESRTQTWSNVSRWVYGISNIERDVPWSEYKKVDLAFRSEQLKKICAFNLKKSPGTHTTDNISFNETIKADKIFIQKQYELYDPEITICCGTGTPFRNTLEFNEHTTKETHHGIEWFEREKEKYVFLFPHPEARIKNSLLVYGLIEAVREILIFNKKH
ncbi:MAG: hypothetical protein JKX76_03815 [Colwellia sp.]|nr:hypothetical protein [Colwellia sp.]